VRIGLVIESFDPQRGGAEQWTYQFARQLVKAGHDVHVLARHFQDAATSSITAHRLANAGSRLAFAAAAEAEARRLRLDVVHDMGSGWHADVFQPHGGSRSAGLTQNLQLVPRWVRPLKRVVSTVLPRHRQFEQLSARQYTGERKIFIALSQMVARDFERYHRVPPRQIRLVYNGVDVERFAPEGDSAQRARLREQLGVRRETLVVLIAAHNFRLKGVPTLIRAVGDLVRGGHDVHLIVAGGKRLTSSGRLAVACGAGRNVSFVGSVTDVRPLYAAADVYAQPTYYDPCSLVVLEAWASGLPVITTPFNGASELMAEGREGLLLENPADHHELAELITRLMDKDVRQRMSRAARALALNHTFERNCAEIVNIYEETVARGRKAA